MLLVLLALLLLLLVAASLLAWRMLRRRRVKDSGAGGDPEPLQNPCQAAPQSDCYANLELQTRPLQGEPEPRRLEEEVEYSLVQRPREDLHYSTVLFTAQDRRPEGQSPSPQPPRQEPEYSVVQRT